MLTGERAWESPERIDLIIQELTLRRMVERNEFQCYYLFAVCSNIYNHRVCQKQIKGGYLVDRIW